MKKTLYICLAATALLWSAACSNGGKPVESAPPSSQEVILDQEPDDTPDNTPKLGPDEDNSPDTEPMVYAAQAGALPKMTEEDQILCDRYLAPLLYSHFFTGDYFHKVLEMNWGPGGIITIYEDLAGPELWPSLTDENGQISASQVEELLMAYFPLDEETIRTAAGEHYDPDAGAYTMMERGGGPRDIAVTGSSWLEHAGVLEIYYSLYEPDDSGSMAVVATGVVQVEPRDDGAFHYLNNRIDYH